MKNLKKVQALAKEVTEAAATARAQAAKAKALEAEATKLLKEVKDLNETVGE